MSETREQVNQKVTLGVIWMLLLRVSTRTIGIVSTIILARLLTPEDYGLVALAMSVYMLLEMFAAFGVDFSLVQKKHLERADYDSAFTFQCICYSTLSLILALSAHQVGNFFDDARLVPIIWLLSVNMVMSGLNNIALVDFRRELQFDKEFKLNISVKLIGFFITVYLAYELRSYWALVIGASLSRFFLLLMGYWFRPYLPRICFSRIGEIFNFSRWLLVMNFAAFIRKQLPNVVLGKVVSSSAVGLHSLGSEVGQSVTQELTAAMNRPVYSGFAKLSHDIQELRKNFLEVLSLQAVLILPLGFGVASVSELLVSVLLGEKWTELGEPLIFLSLGFAVSGISSCCIYIYMALDKSKYCFITSFVGLLVFAPQVFLLVESHGLLGVVYAHLITSVLVAVLAYAIVANVLQTSLLHICRAFWRPYMAAIAMFTLERYWVLNAVESLSALEAIQLIAAVGVGASVYLFVLYGLWLLSGRPHGAERVVIDWLAARVRTIANRRVNATQS